jgi:hypothetical protein
VMTLLLSADGLREVFGLSDSSSCVCEAGGIFGGLEALS